MKGEAVTRAGVLRRLAREERGVAIAELALVLPVVLLILFGVLDFGRALNYWIDETHLANEGARWAVVNKNPASSGTLQAYIKSHADTQQLRDNAQVCISFTDVNGNGTTDAGDAVNMTVSYAFNWLPFIRANVGATTTNLTGTATMRLEQAPSSYSSGCTS